MIKFLKRLFCSHDLKTDADENNVYYACKKCDYKYTRSLQDFCAHDYHLIDKTIKNPLIPKGMTSICPEDMESLSKFCAGKAILVFKCKKCNKVNIEERRL